MSTNRVYEVLKGFLKSDSNEVLALKGNWGIGKTFTWIKLVNDVASDNKIGKPNYSYVSLFGIETLDALKNAIFENTIDSKLIKDGPSLSTLANNFTKIFKHNVQLGTKSTWWHNFLDKSKAARTSLQTQSKKALPHIETLPILRDFFPFLRSASFLSVRNTIICIDDFERKGDTLKAKDVFGLITILKDQRNCKVAFILNDNSLDDEGEKAYVTYREKVVDIELIFSPSSKECTDLIFVENSKSDKHAKKNIGVAS